MKITELVKLVGDENIQVQNIAANLHGVNCGKLDAKVAFFTSREHGQAIAKEAAGISSDMLALVLWIPRSKLPKAGETAKGAQE